MEKLGIKETLEVIDFGMAVSGGVFESLKNDGKITFGDMTNFTQAAMTITPAFENIGQIPAELKDLSAEELGVIQNHIVAKLPDIGEKWMVVARESLQIGISAQRIVQAFKAPAEVV